MTDKSNSTPRALTEKTDSAVNMSQVTPSKLTKLEDIDTPNIVTTVTEDTFSSRHDLKESPLEDIP